MLKTDLIDARCLQFLAFYITQYTSRKNKSVREKGWYTMLRYQQKYWNSNQIQFHLSKNGFSSTHIYTHTWKETKMNLTSWTYIHSIRLWGALRLGSVNVSAWIRISVNCNNKYATMSLFICYVRLKKLYTTTISQHIIPNERCLLFGNSLSVVFAMQVPKLKCKLNWLIIFMTSKQIKDFEMLLSIFTICQYWLSERILFADMWFALLIT